MEKWLCVINPRAGRKNGSGIAAELERVSKGKVVLSFIYWSLPFDASALRREITGAEERVVLAAGGDGTVNFVASCILGTGKLLGIIPLGSGNGLARTLGLSTDPVKAMTHLLAKKARRIDGARVNGRVFFCTSGVGFDAHIGGLFAVGDRRGLRNYIRIVLNELMRYRPQTYTIEFNGHTVTQQAFLVTLANAGQYGNDFYIAPQASIQDGLLHLVVMAPVSLLRAPLVLARVLTRHAHLSSSIKTFSAPRVVLRRDHEGAVHCDGEPVQEGRELVFEIIPGALEVLTGPAF